MKLDWYDVNELSLLLERLPSRTPMQEALYLRCRHWFADEAQDALTIGHAVHEELEADQRDYNEDQEGLYR